MNQIQLYLNCSEEELDTGLDSELDALCLPR